MWQRICLEACKTYRPGLSVALGSSFRNPLQLQSLFGTPQFANLNQQCFLRPQAGSSPSATEWIGLRPGVRMGLRPGERMGLRPGERMGLRPSRLYRKGYRPAHLASAKLCWPHRPMMVTMPKSGGINRLCVCYTEFALSNSQNGTTTIQAQPRRSTRWWNTAYFHRV